MITLIYGLICLLSGDISVDYNILIATVVLDVAWGILAYLGKFKKK